MKEHIIDVSNVVNNMIELMVKRLDPMGERTVIDDVRLLMTDGIPHYNFLLSEVREYYGIAKKGKIITTDDEKFYLNEYEGEMYILTKLL